MRNFSRALAAFAYDLLLVIAIELCAAFLMAPFLAEGQRPPVGWFAIQLALAYGYFIWSWHKAGQTVGQRAWRLEIVDAVHGGRPSLARASLRAAAGTLSLATLGLGMALALVGPGHQSLHDRLSGTRLRARIA